MKTTLYILLLILGLVKTSQAQDYHFSQFDANPFYVNPALTGERIGDHKGIQFNADYRDQMSQYSKYPGSYRSIAAGIDEPLNSKFSIGQFFYSDQSATSSFNTTGFIFAGSYRLIEQSVKDAQNHNLSVGIQFGLVNKSINHEKFTYDAQYSSDASDGFDRSIPSGEVYARQSYFNFNVNFGMYYRVTSKNKKISGFGGLAIYNITRPNQSFFGDGAYSALPIRFNLHGGAVYKATKLLTVMPQILYMNQARANELNVGVMIFSKIENTLYEPLYGISVRNKDAIIFQLGLSFKGITVKASYDVVTNYLKAYRNQGFEFSLVCTLNKKKREAKPEDVAPAPLIVNDSIPNK
jgi:type IX secretion system PorP/SprF family membrane protein